MCWCGRTSLSACPHFSLPSFKAMCHLLITLHPSAALPFLLGKTTPTQSYTGCISPQDFSPQGGYYLLLIRSQSFFPTEYLSFLPFAPYLPQLHLILTNCWELIPWGDGGTLEENVPTSSVCSNLLSLRRSLWIPTHHEGTQPRPWYLPKTNAQKVSPLLLDPSLQNHLPPTL
jgi:hypothetical protein